MIGASIRQPLEGGLASATRGREPASFFPPEVSEPSWTVSSASSCPAYLLALGYGPVETGVIATATLTGSALLTLALGVFAHLSSGRALLMGVSVDDPDGPRVRRPGRLLALLLIAFVGTLNPSSGDVSAFLPLEQAQLSHLVEARHRTRLFAQYNFIGSIGAAIGALGAGLPSLAVRMADVPLKSACQSVFILYAAVGVTVLLLFTAVAGRAVRHHGTPDLGRAVAPHRPDTRRAIQSGCLAGGFVAQSLLALWLFDRFGLSLPRPEPSSFGRACCRPSPTSRRGSRSASASSTRWYSRTFRQTCVCSSCPSLPTSGWRWPSC